MKKDVMKDLKLNREERRKLTKQIEKETGKKNDDITVEDVIKTISANRKKSRRK